MAFKEGKFVLSCLWIASIVASQSIYINLEPGYSSLSCCAQVPLSLAVRDMSQGCGDQGQLTSYNCFCTTSSSHFSSLISSEVQVQCSGNSTEAAQAVSVFNEYCAVGPNGTQAKATKTGSLVVCNSTATLASPTSRPTNSVPSSTSNPSTTASLLANTNSTSGTVPTSRLSTGAKAGIGVAVSLGVIGVISVIMTMFLHKRKQRVDQSRTTPELDANQNERGLGIDPDDPEDRKDGELSPQPIHEIEAPKQTHELESPKQVHELRAPGNNAHVAELA